MFLVPIVLFAGLAVPVALLSSFLTDDQIGRIEITGVGTLLLFAVVMLLWKAANARPASPAEVARNAWLHRPQVPSTEAGPDGSHDPGAANAWGVLNSEAIEHSGPDRNADV